MQKKSDTCDITRQKFHCDRTRAGAKETYKKDVKKCRRNPTDEEKTLLFSASTSRSGKGRQERALGVDEIVEMCQQPAVEIGTDGGHQNEGDSSKK